ncbi:CLUMA_CG020617, isoform A [Clunio marinus]|uniref:CLUMA_CG020617, isoform A n=1 Tax=Clunio marinus TaxID=568069 RepID=A0A1J1J6Q0_9DIPT|nr:CLUMA_CG020617, isoform A [Clunio marinus]
MKLLQIILLFAFAALNDSTPLASSESSSTKYNPECSKGVSFWCQSVIKTLIKVQPKETTKLLTCNQCKVFGYLMERKFNETSKDDLLENLLGVCGEILSFSDCSKVVMMRFNKIYDALGTILKSNSLCNKSEICKSDQNKLLPSNVPSIISPCHFCLHFIKELDEKYIVNKTEIEFKSNLENFCDLIEPYSSKCEEFADQYYDAIYKYLSSKSNVTEFCYSIKICKRKHFIEHEGISTTINKKFISEADFLKKFDESSLIIHKNGSWCNTCQSLLRSIIGKLDEYSTEDEMVKTLKYVCKQLPSVIQNECENIVDLYADAIIWLLDRSLDPNFICPKIKLCPHILDLEHLQSTAIDGKPTCSFCLFTVQEIYDFVSGRKVKENIENAMTMLCNHLSGKLLSQCLEFSTNFSEKIVEMIMADIPPQEACMEIKLCHNQVEPYEETTEIKIYNPNEIQTENPMTEHPQCVLCEFIMSVLQTELNDINVDIKIKQIVHNICHKMPTTVTSYCRNFIDFYFERIIELLKIIKPSQICSTMKLCLHQDD